VAVISRSPCRGSMTSRSGGWFLTGIFQEFEGHDRVRYGEAARDPRQGAGTVMVVAFELEDRRLPRSTAARVQVQRGHLVPGEL